MVNLAEGMMPETKGYILHHFIYMKNVENVNFTGTENASLGSGLHKMV
jgi:hypothetical protein